MECDISKLTLYNLKGCPFCKMVRDKLSELGLEYEKVDVSHLRWQRREVYEVSGQYLVPVLVDGDLVLDDEGKIIEHLEAKYRGSAGRMVGRPEGKES